MTKKHWGLSILVAVLALISGQVSQYLINKINEKPPAISAFSFIDSTGKTRASREWQNKILVVNFWATWCATCRTEMPVLMQLQRDYADKNVQFIGIAIEDNAAVVMGYLKTLPLNYPILLGGDKALLLSKQWGNTQQIIPYTVIINSQGVIVHRQQGELSAEVFASVLHGL